MGKPDSSVHRVIFSRTLPGPLLLCVQVGMHVVQRMSAQKRTEFLEAARSMRGSTPDSAEEEATGGGMIMETPGEDSSENGADSS